MHLGDISIYTDNNGRAHVGCVTKVHPDGKVDLSILRPSIFEIPTSSDENKAETFYNPFDADPEAPAVVDGDLPRLDTGSEPGDVPTPDSDK